MNEDETDSPFDDDDEVDMDDDYEDDDLEDDLEDYSDESMDEEAPFEENKHELKSLEEEDEDEKDEVSENPMLSPEKTNLSKVPLTVHMEIARFSLSLEELKKIASDIESRIKRFATQKKKLE
jgi:flagellar motor switch/type III secretory pathway protein FliN